MQHNKQRALLVWDAEGPPPVGDWTTVLWSSFDKGTDPSTISIPGLVEEQADALRSRYLAWVYELGETVINGKRVIDHLELRPGFSYWWMTSLAQKFNASGTSQIDNAIKALALESLVSELKPKSIILVSNNNKIALTLQSFCQNLRLSFKRDFAKESEKPKPIARLIYNSLPSPVWAIIYFLWYLLRSLPLIYKKQLSPPAFNGEITFIDVLVHLDGQSFTTGKFISNYWTALVDKLFQSNIKTNWLHNYFYQRSIPTFVKAQKLIGCFNRFSVEKQSHALIEENLGLLVFIKALKDYLRTIRVSFSLTAFSRYFRPDGSALDLWPMFKDEWIDSLRGSGAMVNCLRVCLYEKTFSILPYQKLGVYIQENQPWEMALIYAWKSAGHGKLIGVPHATVRYWDLRYFYDFRSYVRKGKNDLPIPDLVAVNGPVAMNYYLQGGYPEYLLREVEALRFLHLLNRFPENVAQRTQRKSLKVLVCGDFLTETTYKLLSWLLVVSQTLPPETTYIFKPHPAYPINLSDFALLKLKVTNDPLAELLADCDVVFTGISSVAVDAYCFGIPVVQMRDGNNSNMSPLRDLKGVVYVTNPMELAEALRNAKQCERVIPEETYFCLDKELPRWQKLLGMRPTDAIHAAVS